MDKKQNDEVRLTIRLPRNLWVALRRSQENGEIKSIQQAAIDGMSKLIGYSDKTQNTGN